MGNADRELQTAAQNLQGVLLRLQDGVVAQIAAGEHQEGLDDKSKRDLADLLRVAHERLTYTRAAVPESGRSIEQPDGHGSASWLPLNRKERFYTGTVLPGLVASDGFAHLHRLLELCGLPDVAAADWGYLGAPQDLTFFTEYGFAESVFTDEDKQAWPTLVDGDTPDIVIAGPDWLLAVEAKMFHNPNGASLERQMDRQRVLVDYWSRTRNLDAGRVRHVLLLPEPLSKRVGGLRYDVVTWEQVLERYAVVGPRYWKQVLSTALDRHQQLQSRMAAGGANADSLLSGAAIESRFHDGTLEFTSVGRNGGLPGTTFTEDVATGRWRTVRYEVRREPLPGNRNWFSVDNFIAKIARSALDEVDGS